ncbi:SH3 domain-containing protein [Mesorhizobium sp. M1405]|uniref:SH3 domain-containing protein n=1 Tax=unclassified Mesorhizobium TaxID=325217 RepID=UPI00333CB5EF
MLIIGIVGVAAVLVVQTSDTKPGDAPNSTLAPRTDRQEPGQTKPLPPANRDISPSNPPPYVEAAKGPVKQDAPVGDSWPTSAGDQHTPSASSGNDLGSSVSVEPQLGEQFPTAVVTRTANIRSDPSMAGAVTSQVPAGTALTVVDINGRWARVRKDEITLGWINRSLLAAQPSYQ